MKKTLFILLSVLFISLSLGSCEKEENKQFIENNSKVTKNNEYDLKEYLRELRITLRSDFSELEKNYKIYGDWVIAGEKIYEGNELALNYFRKNLDQSKVDSSRYDLYEVNEIIKSAEKYYSFEEYNYFLNERFEYFLSESNLSFEDKLFTLTFLVNYSESLYFFNRYNNLTENSFEGHFKKSNWWKDWGKCLTAIAGGAVTGATTIGLAGAAVGTVTLPIVGTVAGGTVGAIGGGIGGALTGAATGC